MQDYQTDPEQQSLNCFFPGNALGYVRLLRSGLLRYSASSARFVPEGGGTSFVQMLEEGDDLVEKNATTREAVEALDRAARANEGDNDYLKVQLHAKKCLLL